MNYIDPAYEIAAVFFDIVVCAFVNLVYTDSSKTTKAFKRLAGYMTFACIIDAMTVVMMDMKVPVPVSIHYLMHSFNILSSSVAASSYTEYVIICTGVDVRKSLFFKINIAVMVILVFLVLQNVMTGNVFSYTVEQGYVHGPLFYACSMVIPGYYIWLGTGFMAVNHKSYTSLQLISMISSFVVLVTIYALQVIFFQGASLVYFAASLALLILFFTLETPDFHRLEKTIEKLKEAEKQASDARRRAEEANDVKSEFLSQMSHEIRTPINSILGFDGFIIENTREAATSEYAVKIKGAAENLLAFFNNLLTVIAQKPGEDIDMKSLFDYAALVDTDYDEVLVPIIPNSSILVVDDNAMNIDLLLKILSRTEARIDTASDGQKALMKLRRKSYDLIIMDYMMPVMDGVETFSIMREEHLSSGSPVVMLTAGGLRGDEERFKELGFDAYLTKPVVANDLYELLSDLMPMEQIEQRVPLETLFYKEKKPDAAPQIATRSLEEVFTYLDTKAGLEFCMEDEEFYISQLEMFATSKKGDELDDFYKDRDWNNYLISVHALKSTARTIGANAIADEALALENALKEGRQEKVLEGHASLKNDFDEMAKAIGDGIRELKSGAVVSVAGSNDDGATGENGISSRDSAGLSAQILLALANTVDARDENGQGRSMRVAKYSAEIARRLGKSEQEQQDLYLMGLVHDIGKLVIPEKILRKPDVLTDEETEIVRQHPVIGYEILRNISEMPGLATGARWHHERYDGTGYPDGLLGEEIPLSARIIGIADAYDAMMTKRSYASVMPPMQIIKELQKNKGSQFDPQLVDITVKMIEESIK